MRFFVRLSLLVCFALTAFAQGDRGTITGTVSDPVSAIVPGATVSAKNTESGAQFDTVTTGTGNYTLPSLPATPPILAVAIRLRRRRSSRRASRDMTP